MSLSSNTDAICSDVYKCLSSNGIKIKKDCVFIDNSSGELFVKALTDESPSRQFSMKIGDNSIVCDDNHNIQFDMSPFKGDIVVPKLSEDAKNRYYEDFFGEEEMQESLAE